MNQIEHAAGARNGKIPEPLSDLSVSDVIDGCEHPVEKSDRERGPEYDQDFGCEFLGGVSSFVHTVVM